MLGPIQWRCIHLCTVTWKQRAVIHSAPGARTLTGAYWETHGCTAAMVNVAQQVRMLEFGLWLWSSDLQASVSVAFVARPSWWERLGKLILKQSPRGSFDWDRWDLPLGYKCGFHLENVLYFSPEPSFPFTAVCCFFSLNIPSNLHSLDNFKKSGSNLGMLMCESACVWSRPLICSVSAGKQMVGLLGSQKTIDLWTYW